LFDSQQMWILEKFFPLKNVDLPKMLTPKKCLTLFYNMGLSSTKLRLRCAF
jgi:hypothetical protein